MPVEISDWNDLDAVRNDLTADYVLVNDLDSDTDGYAGLGDDFEPIGPEPPDDGFRGTFDGQGNIIRDLEISANQRGVALFANLGFGGDGTEIIENLIVGGSVTNTGTEQSTGGVVGEVSEGTIQNCASFVDVTSDGDRVGSLCGNFSGAVIKDSYATGSVEGDGQVGGLVGGSQLIETSYAVGQVSGNTDVGGLVGQAFGDVVDSYWDTESSGQSTSDGGTGLTTAEMQGSEAETNMDGFDFEDVWDSVLESDDDVDEDGYPVLQELDRKAQLVETLGVGAVAFGAWRSLSDNRILKTF